MKNSRASPSPDSPGERAAGSAYGRIRDAAVCAGIFVAVIGSRLPGIRCPVELNPDESQLMVQALRYADDMLPWRSVDGTTSGPLNSWFVLLVRTLGLPFTYSCLHAVSALLLGVIVATSYLTVRLFSPMRQAVWVGFVGTLAVAFSSAGDFMHFSTEHVPATMLAAATYGCVWVLKKNTPTLPVLLVAAFLAGLVPWAKLQGVPVAGIVGAFALWLAVRRDGDSSGPLGPLVRGALVVGAGLLPSLLILVPVWRGGVLSTFWDSYVVSGFGYAGPFGLEEIYSRSVRLFLESEFRGMIVSSLAAAGVMVGALVGSRTFRLEAFERRLVAFSVLGAGAAGLCCIRSSYNLGHYQIWLIGPLMLSVGALFFVVARAFASSANGTLRRWVSFGLAASLAAPTLTHAFANWADGESARSRLATSTRDAERVPQKILGRAVREATPSAKTMAVWGWMPSLYLETGYSCTTRHAIGHFLIDPVPRREQLRATFMQDIRAAKPDVIVDAVAHGCFPWFWDLRVSGLESFPEFATYVNENYTLVARVSLNNAKIPMRIYRRR